MNETILQYIKNDIYEIDVNEFNKDNNTNLLQEELNEQIIHTLLEYLDENYADRTELKTFNAVNATLAACAGKGLATKAKAVLGDKMLTQYTVSVDAE